MTLDLTRIAGQIEAMGAHLATSAREGKQRLGRAQSRYDREGRDLGPLKQKLEVSDGKVTWMPAGIHEDWDKTYRLPDLPSDFAVLATDGSQIDLERHAPASCYLINIGLVMLRYGSEPDAHLSSRASLFYRDEDLVLTDPSHLNQRVMFDAKMLKFRRGVMEVEALADLAEGAVRVPCLALLDGTLILWELGGREVRPFVKEQVLGAYLGALDRLSQLPGLATASYISNPRATDVVDALRIAECPQESPNCDRHCRDRQPSESRPCDQVAEGVRDADLFRGRLGPGDRSPLFESHSRVLENYREHKVNFFYLNAGDEIARAEVPEWVAKDAQKLDLVHALVYDQVRRGQGYPVALMEAHEQAVVQATDRLAFWSLVEEVMAEGRLTASTTSKAQSKRTRGI